MVDAGQIAGVPVCEKNHVILGKETKGALTPAAGSLSVRATLEYVCGLDPQDHSGFALKKRIFVATQVLSGEHVYMLGRALLGTTLVDNRSAYHYGPPRILRVDNRDCYSWIAIDVVRLEMTHDGID